MSEIKNTFLNLLIGLFGICSAFYYLMFKNEQAKRQSKEREVEFMKYEVKRKEIVDEAANKSIDDLVNDSNKRHGAS